MTKKAKNKKQSYFSGRILLTSFIILLFNLAWFSLAFLGGQEEQLYRTVAPTLRFAQGQDVFIQGPFDDSWIVATPNQVIRTGTSVQTGVESFTEIELEGSLIRLDQNTEVLLTENQFPGQTNIFNPRFPRLVFELKSGNVWVNAQDTIALRTSQATATFTHASGSYQRNSPLSRIMVITGGVDLNLRNEKGEILTQFLVPFYHQVAFFDSQITSSYAYLKTSKLKKELKLAGLIKSMQENQWIQRNVNEDLNTLKGSKRVESASTYRFLDRYYGLRHTFSLLSDARQAWQLKRLQNVFNYVLGGINTGSNINEAKNLLVHAEALKSTLEGNSDLNIMLSREFHSINHTLFDSIAFYTKDYLRSQLVNKENTVILRSYLSDIEYELRQGKIELVNDHVQRWLSQWKPDFIRADSVEFENQSRLFHSLLITYSDRIPGALLGTLDRLKQSRLKQNGNREEVLLTFIDERLEISAALVSHFRYDMAKQYLKTSYETLENSTITITPAAWDLFFQRTELLAQRIDFAEKQLHGAAKPINENDFREFINKQVRDQYLSENLKLFLSSDNTETYSSEKRPATEEVIHRFAAAHINVAAEDIFPDKDHTNQFIIREARLINRSPEGSSITFEALYDFGSDAVQNIMIDSSPLKGDFKLEDLATVLTANGVHRETQKDSTIISDGITAFLEEGDEQRSELLAQDLAIQLLLNELRRAEVYVADSKNIEITDRVTLELFHIKEATLPGVDTKKDDFRVRFTFDLSRKNVLNARLLNDIADLPNIISLQEFVSTVQDIVVRQKDKNKTLQNVRAELEAKGLLIEPANLNFEGGSLSRFRFSELSVRTLPLTFSGIYDRDTKRLAEIHHEGFTQKNVEIDEYFNTFGTSFIINHLAEKGIKITRGQLTATFPFQRIQINHFRAGEEILTFDVNLKAGQLRNVTVVSTGDNIDSMTYEEFRNVVKGFGS